MEELRQRLQDFHKNEGVSYKAIATVANIPLGSLYQFSGGYRNMKEEPAAALDKYLKDRNY